LERPGHVAAALAGRDAVAALELRDNMDTQVFYRPSDLETAEFLEPVEHRQHLVRLRSTDG
jgi:hypothetical protein